MPKSNQLPDDDCLTWWFHAAVTGAGTMASLALAIVLLCNTLRGQTFCPVSTNDVIAAAAAAVAFALLGVTTYAIGRGHGIKTQRRAAHS